MYVSFYACLAENEICTIFNKAVSGSTTSELQADPLNIFW